MNKQWIPKRLEVENLHGHKTIMDVGKDAVVTVFVKGPYVDLTLTEVMNLQMKYDSEEPDLQMKYDSEEPDLQMKYDSEEPG